MTLTDDAAAAWTDLYSHAAASAAAHRATGIARAADRRGATSRDRSPVLRAGQDDAAAGIHEAFLRLPNAATRAAMVPDDATRRAIFGGAISGNRDAAAGRVVGRRRRRDEANAEALDAWTTTHRDAALDDAGLVDLEANEEAAAVLASVPAWAREALAIARGIRPRPPIDRRRWAETLDAAEEIVRDVLRERGRE